ncbi:MAG: 4-hydroxy-tetrahydrodipicolinate synthase [Acidimicrobiales bacterium]
MARFGRVVSPMVTPFDEDLRLDLDAAVALARWLVGEQRNDGLVVCGTTGESPTLTDPEKLDLVRAVSEAVTVPVVAGTTSNDTANSVELTRQAASCGAAGVLAVTPYYNRPSQLGLQAHFRAIAASTDLPVMLYDIPFRTGRKIDTAVLLRLAHDVPNIVAVKDSAGDLAGTAQVISGSGPGFEVYCGDDTVNLPMLALGAVGLVGVAAQWAGPLMVELVSAVEAGDLERARAVNARLLPSYAYESGDDAPNPLPAKAILRALGQPVGSCRSPMGPDPDDLDQRARQVLADLAAAT